MKKLILFSTLILAFSVSAETQYFFGKTKMWTPDKRTALGESPYLVKRVLDKKKGLILETATTVSRKTGKIYEEHTMTLKQTDKKSRFDIVDKTKKFNGFVMYKGDEWNWDKWTYAVAFKNGDKLVGEGTLSSTALKTEKLILNSKKAAKLMIVDDLKAIDEATYKLRFKDFVTGKFLQNKDQ